MARQMRTPQSPAQNPDPKFIPFQGARTPSSPAVCLGYGPARLQSTPSQTVLPGRNSGLIAQPRVTGCGVALQSRRDVTPPRSALGLGFEKVVTRPLVSRRDVSPVQSRRDATPRQRDVSPVQRRRDVTPRRADEVERCMTPPRSAIANAPPRSPVSSCRSYQAVKSLTPMPVSTHAVPSLPSRPVIRPTQFQESSNQLPCNPIIQLITHSSQDAVSGDADSRNGNCVSSGGASAELPSPVLSVVQIASPGSPVSAFAPVLSPPRSESFLQRQPPIHEELYQLTQASARISDDLRNAKSEMARLREENQELREEKMTQQVVQQRLKSENGELWAQLQQHKQQIEDLGRNLREVQEHAGLRSSIAADPGIVEQKAVVVQCWDWPDEPLQMQSQNVAAMSPEETSKTSVVAPNGNLASQIPGREMDLAAHLQELRAQMVSVEEQGESLRAATKVIEEEYSRIYQDSGPDSTRSTVESIRTGAVHLSTLDPNGRTADELEVVQVPNVVEVVQDVVTRTQIIDGAMMTGSCAVLLSGGFFDTVHLGQNLALSEDGSVATRIRGCRQSVALGSEPLPSGPSGCWLFEVEILETVPGWVSGLGIGVTTSDPSELCNIPEKAWQIPSTAIAGYWGRAFCDGREYRTPWKADELNVGDRVICLITPFGGLAVFVNSVRVIWMDTGMQALASGRLFAVVDVFSAAKSVKWQPNPVLPMGAVDQCLEYAPVISPLPSARLRTDK